MSHDWRTLDVSVDIEASPGQVWAVLADPAGYGAWSPFVVALDPGPSGTLEVGVVARLRVRMFPPAERTLVSPERVLAVDPPRRLAWEYAGLPRFLLSAARMQDLEPRPGGTTRYRTHQRYRGLLAPLVLLLLRRRILAGFEATAQALKRAVEGGQDAPCP